jgi:4-amino-4-deoxy-L-arabinose transferase-like glycosyltransferase
MARHRSERWAEIAVFLAAGMLLLSGLGETGLWAPDEPRYAQVAEEVRAFEQGPRGLVLLHLNGEVYSQKPPLYYWLAALVGFPAGRMTETLARLPSALSGMALLLVTLRLGAGLFPRSPSTGEARRAGPGLWSAALLLTVFRFAHLARRVQLDVMLALFEVLALLAFWRRDSGVSLGRANVAWLHGAMGLAVLTKGPVGLMPILVIAAYLAWEKRLSELRPLLPAWAAVFSLGPALVWLAGATAVAPAGFLDHALLDNLIGRVFSGTSHARPFYYFLYQFPLDFLPWTLLWPVVAAVGVSGAAWGRPSTASARPWRFLLAWVGVFLLVFSASAGKRGLYLLPAFPAVAILCGASVHRWLLRARPVPRWIVRSLVTLAALVGIASAVFATGGATDVWQSVTFAPPTLFWTCLVAITALSAAAWIAFGRWATSAGPRVAVLVSAVFCVELVLFRVLYPAYDAEKSPRPIAEAAADLVSVGEPVAVFRHSALVGGVLFYGIDTVVPLEKESEARAYLESGGRVIIARRKHVELLQQLGPLTERAAFRSGSRQIVLLSTTTHTDASGGRRTRFHGPHT